MSQVLGQKRLTFAPRIRRQIFSSATENRISDNKKWLADFLENFYFRVIGTLNSSFSYWWLLFHETFQYIWNFGLQISINGLTKDKESNFDFEDEIFV